MTKKIIFPLAALILLSACAGKFGLQKRRYTKGYYFSASKHQASAKKDEAVAAKHVKHNTTATPVEEALPLIVAAQPALTKYETTSTNQAVANKTAPAVKAAHAPVLTANAAMSKTQMLARAKEFKAVVTAAKNQKASKGGDADANLVVLVILSLFPILALIAMYIHDGHKITTNFWVDLILHLTIIGYIIFALLVVLDVVDLSK